MSDQNSTSIVPLQDPFGAISQINAGISSTQSLEAVQSTLMGMVEALDTSGNSKLDLMVADANERLNDMLIPGGVLEADVENLIATVKVLNDIKLRTIEAKRKALETALKAQAQLESRVSLTMQLNSAGGGADVQSSPSPAFSAAPADTANSSFAGIGNLQDPQLL